MEKLRIVVGGFIGLYPIGGATWDYIQYPLGLKKLGHDVYYIEDTMQYPVYQQEGELWNDATYCIKYLQHVMEGCGLGEKWAYRDVASGQSFGMSEAQIQQVIKSADVFINISCSTFLREEYLKIPKRILIDSDPMFTQVRYHLELEGNPEMAKCNTRHMLENHNYLFTFGENIGRTDCWIPTFGFKWLTTRQPICLDLWKDSAMNTGSSFSSIMNWSEKKKLKYNNEEWGQKDVEFNKFKGIPKQSRQGTFKVVINRSSNPGSTFNLKDLELEKWQILDPHKTVATPSDYKNFIEQSFAEFSVAKETYVKSNSGWFSCRSACYLAAGKPVITQDTGWSKFIPAGQGLHAFTDVESALKGIEQVIAYSRKESKAATEIAEEYFDSDKILTDMLERAN